MMKQFFDAMTVGGVATVMICCSGCKSGEAPGPAAGKAVGAGVGVAAGNVAGFGKGAAVGAAGGYSSVMDPRYRMVRYWKTETTADGRTIQVPYDVLVDEYGRPVKRPAPTGNPAPPPAEK